MEGVLVISILTLVRLVVPISLLLIAGSLIGRHKSARSR